MRIHFICNRNARPAKEANRNMQKKGELRSYKCSLDGKHWTKFNARTRGQAKIAFYHYLDGDYDYMRMLCRVDGDIYTSDEFKRNAEYRNTPLAYCGMVVSCNGRRGVIVGHNYSANLDLAFDDGGYGSAHPNWKMDYFGKNGELVYQF